jgi:predicted amidohydrolase
MSSPLPKVNGLNVAALQLSSQAVVSENLERAASIAAEAARAGAELLVLPENFALMGDDAQKRGAAELLGDESAPIQRALRDIARREQVAIVAGGFPERSADPQRPFNTSLLLDAMGAQVAVYRKLHLFDAELGAHGSARESGSTTAGGEIVVGSVNGFTLGLSICYDLRFPELYRALVDRGAEILSIPAAFTLYTGKDHWHVLLRARAIESGCYVVAAAQWGKHPEGRATFGHALIVDPWGAVIAEASDREGFALGRVERSFIQEVRTRVPCLQHRRLPIS